ncbi:MAG TPA: FecR domain-containing protein [Verrucomicrobiae bacterium]|jgi:hypothetical protein|nr:FecR domain-containing protein [Verrucomicrobiae bacterium]
MNHQDKKPKDILDQAIQGLRAEQANNETVTAAGERVWQRLGQELGGAAGDLASIRGCEDVRSLLRPYRSGELAPARALLVEDHLRECVSCRKQAETGYVSQTTLLPWKQELPRGGFVHFGWAAAAILLVALGVSAYFVNDWIARPSGSRAQVASVDGRLFRVSDSGERMLAVGDELQEGERVRSAAGTRAKVRLRDGSLVEMNERAEFSVSARYRDTTIHLDRGNIIVQAAKRRTGHLYVAAKDCRVSVTGTVFSVNSGIKGSRVSVIEGEVRVAQGGATSVLHPGDQLATDVSVSSVPIQQEIAWSQDLDKHLALLAEFNHFLNKLQQVQLPGLRYQSRLLPLLPQNTVLYAGVPNLGDAVHQADLLFQQELQESPVLNEWWTKVQAEKGAPNFEQILEDVHQLGRYLGDEIVFAVAENGRRGAGPLIVAEVRMPGLKEFIQNEIMQHQKADGPNLRVLEEHDLAGVVPSANGREVFILVRADLVVVSGDIATLRSFDASLPAGAGFAATPFGQRMAAAYHDGAGLLFGANLEQLQQDHNQAGVHKNVAFQQSGFADLRFLVAERKEVNGQTYNHADLGFNGPRHGVASWLAAPAPIGGLDFISKDASAVMAFVAKKPADMLDDMLGMATSANPDAETKLSEVESQLNINLRHDLAEALGGEVTLALDGPLLPTPSWRVIVEVYDPARLQTTLQQLVNAFNTRPDAATSPERLRLEQQSSGGLVYYTISLTGSQTPFELIYTFIDGYLVLAPDRAMVMSAIRVHQSGNSLANSPEFHALLPQDNHANVSALVYQNLAPVVGPILQQLSPSQQQSLAQLAAETKPSVVCAYGDQNAIEVASNSRFFGLDLNTLALSTLLKMAHHHPGVRM